MLCPANHVLSIFLSFNDQWLYLPLIIVLYYMPTFIGVIMHACFYIVVPFFFVQIQPLLVAMKINYYYYIIKSETVDV